MKINLKVGENNKYNELIITINIKYMVIKYNIIEGMVKERLLLLILLIFTHV